MILGCGVGCDYIVIREMLSSRADYTATSAYYIDFEKGSIVHSKTASRGQFNRYFNDAEPASNLGFLSYPQSASFYKKNRTGEFYLNYLRQKAINELGRATLQASPSYILNHQRVFDMPLNTLQYPVCQTEVVGFVRSPLDRQKLVDWMSKLVSEAIKYGQTPMQKEDKEYRKKIVLDNMRAIAFAPPASA